MAFTDSGAIVDLDKSLVSAAINPIVMSNLSLWLTTSGVILQDPRSILDRYFDAFTEVTYKFDVDEQLYYKPETVAQSVYGTTDLWYVILRLNGMRSHMDFTRKQIKLTDPAIVNRVLGEIVKAYTVILADSHKAPKEIEDLTIHKIL